MRGTHLVAGLMAVLFVFVSASETRGAIVNGDFETGDLSGWTLTSEPGSVTTISAESDGGGGFRAVLAVDSKNQESRAAMTQLFTVTEGSDLSFDYEWDIAGSLGFVLGAGVDGVGERIANTVSSALTGSGTRTIRLLPGEYTFRLYSTNATDPGNFTGWFAVDNLTLTAVPEPASMVTLFIGLAMLTHWGRRLPRSAAKS